MAGYLHFLWLFLVGGSLLLLLEFSRRRLLDPSIDKIF